MRMSCEIFALADDGLIDAAQVDVAVDAGNIEVHVQRDIAVIVHARRDFHVDADIDEGELRVDQRIDADAADAGLEAAGGGGLAVADFERRLHVVHGAQLRRLQHLRVGVAQHRCSRAPGMVVEKSAVERRPRLDKGTSAAGAASWWWWRVTGFRVGIRRRRGRVVVAW